MKSTERIIDAYLSIQQPIQILLHMVLGEGVEDMGGEGRESIHTTIRKQLSLLGSDPSVGLL